MYFMIGFKKLYFVLFNILLLILFYKTAENWYQGRYYGIENAAYGIYYFLIEGLIAILLISRDKILYSGIHGICWLWVLLILITNILNFVNGVTIAKTVFWPLLFEAMFCFSKINIKINYFIFFFIIFSLGGLYLFYDALLYKNFESQTNTIYYFILTVPMLLIPNNRKWRTFVIIIAVFCALLSLKRSIILSFIVYGGLLFVFSSFRKGKKTQVMISVTILILLLSLSTFFSNIAIVNRLSERMSEEDISHGRFEIYDYTIAMQMQSNTKEWLFGHGHNAVQKNSFLVISAHNEWLEILYDYGLLTLFVYSMFWFHLIKRCFYLFRIRSNLFVPYLLSLSLFLVMSFVSQLILYVSYFLYLVCFWALIEGICQKEDSQRLLKVVGVSKK